MKAIVIDQCFGLDQLKEVQRDIPKVEANQLLLKMKAISLNYRDLLMVEGNYNPRQPLPLIPCSDGVGEIVEIGADVDRFKVGDRVAPLFAQGWISGKATHQRIRNTLGGPIDGVLTEYMVVDQESAVLIPEYLSDHEAATLPCAALTAWTALAVEGKLKAGDWVLIQGSGGVSQFALAIVKSFGAKAIVLSSRDHALEKMREMGADKTINYKSMPKWGSEVRRLADGNGVDLTVEVGGAQTLSQTLKATKIGGYIGLIGILSGHSAPLNLTEIFMKAIHIQGIFVGHRDSFEAMNQAFAANEIRPVIDQVFSFKESKAAFELLKSQTHFGKIVIDIAT